MIPEFIKRVLTTTGLASVVIFCLLVVRDWRTGLAFEASAAWAMANLVVWSALITSGCQPGPVRGAKVCGLVAAKLACLAAGVVALRLLPPMTAGQGWAVIGGICSVFLVVALKALGARLTCPKGELELGS